MPVDFALQRRPDAPLRIAVVSPTAVGGAEAPLAVYELGGPPQGCRQPAALHSLPGQAVAVESVRDGWAVQLREPAAVWLDGELLVLDEQSARDTGHDLFYAPLGGQAACASCHLEGLDDGHRWTRRGGTPERTLSLAGGVSARPALSWQAHPSDLRQLARDHFAGAGASLRDDQLDAFIAWLDVIRAPTLPAQGAELGREIFGIRCADCHGADGRSPEGIAQVGDESRRVPDLIGVGTRRGLMRDGCANSTLDVMSNTECGGLWHAVQDPVDRDVLNVFLQSL